MIGIHIRISFPTFYIFQATESYTLSAFHCCTTVCIKLAGIGAIGAATPLYPPARELRY